jgi:hypothetical protein
MHAVMELQVFLNLALQVLKHLAYRRRLRERLRLRFLAIVLTS